jgi:hypothetical protein
VNLFSHFFFDQDPNSPAYNFGLLAPDLLRNFTPNQYNKTLVSHPQETLDIERGCLQHLIRDKDFHNSAFFEEVYQELRNPVRNVFIDTKIPRFWFGIHIMIEMWLDRLLIMKNPNQLENFYRILDHAKKDIPAFLDRINHEDPETFMIRFDRFIESRYLEKYPIDLSILFGLNQVFKSTKVINETWTKHQEHHLLELIPVIDRALESRLILLPFKV